VICRYHTQEIINYSPPWHTLARDVVKLVKKMSEDEIEELKSSFIGGTAVLAKYQAS